MSIAQKMWYMNPASIRFDAKRKTKTELNGFSANVDLPLQRFRSPIRSCFSKGGKGARSSIYDFSPRI